MEETQQTKQHAAEASVTADTGRYVSEEARAVDELRAVQFITEALAGKLDLEPVLAVAVGWVADLVAAEGSSILLIDPETKAMTFHVAEGPGAKAAKTIPLPPGAGICGHVARTGQPAVVNDVQNDPRFFSRVDKSSGVTTRNILCVPLRTAERLWGVLEVINKYEGADFDASDLRVAEAIGGQVALALENVHLHNEVVRQERMAAVGQTVSGLAHCVKNILNGIRSGSAVIDRHIGADNLAKVRDGWQVVRKNNEMLGNLVLDMLSLARDTKFHPFPTDVNDLVEQVSRLVVDRASERNIGVTWETADDLDEVSTDPTQFYRCLLNLVSNAVDACESGASICTRVYRAAGRDRLTVSISDTGSGIAPEHRDKLFTEFFTTKGGRGTGLGLPVTRKLIAAMGGTITFHSVVGRGTKFVIALPIKGATVAEKETTA